MPLFPRSYTIQYERLISSPKEEMEKLVKHTGIYAKPFKMDPATLVDPQRTNRYDKNEFAWTGDLAIHHGETLKGLGYK